VPHFLKAIFQRAIQFAIGNKDNPYHPLVLITGEPKIGDGTYIGALMKSMPVAHEWKLGKVVI
jgi:hypothetical protein